MSGAELDAPIAVEAMRPEDWSQVARIFAEGIETGAATFETEVPEWDDWDAHHERAGRLVVRDGDRVLGWAALNRVSIRDVYRGVAECSVYVGSDARGRGVGELLLGRLLEEADGAGIWTLEAVVFPENAPSIAMLERCGFRRVGLRERLGRVHGEWHDVVLLEHRSPNL